MRARCYLSMTCSEYGVRHDRAPQPGIGYLRTYQEAAAIAARSISRRTSRFSGIGAQSRGLLARLAGGNGSLVLDQRRLLATHRPEQSFHGSLEQRALAQDVEAGVARLETDLTAWRTVLGQAKTLPVKMLASAAMNDDVAVMGGLLQRSDLDERYVSRMAKLARPLESSEQSLRWPMQSQFVLATKTLDEAVSQNRADTRPFYGAIAAALPLPKQRRFNAYADYYEAAGKASADGRYADLPKLSQFVRVAPYSVSAMVVNPIESVVGVDPMPTWETYAGRVLETDARLRLASLQAWLRRTPPEQDLLTRLAKAGQGLYDPFTGLPMLVNMKKGVLYSVGPDLKDNEAHERLDLVAQIPSVAWAGGKKSADGGKTK